MEVSSAAAGSSSNILQTAHGLEVPGTPQEVPGPVAPVSPRHSPTTRTHATDVDEGESKRAKTEEHKKQRINRLAEEQESMMRTVRFGTETYHTLDSYEAAFQSDDVESSEEVWIGENDLYFAGVTEKLWSDHDLSQQPPTPDAEIDHLADEVDTTPLGHAATC